MYHIFSNSHNVQYRGNITLNLSDHDLVYIVRKKSKCIRESTAFTGRSYRNYDRETFQQCLMDLEWHPFYAMTDPDHAWAYLLHKIEAEIDKMCPVKEIKIKKPKAQWISNELLEFINDKDDLLILAKTTNSPDDWNAARIARNYVASLIKNAKKDYLIGEVDNNNDPNKFWSKMGTLFRDRPETGQIKITNPQTNSQVPENETPDYVNNFFSNIGNDILNSLNFDINNWTYKGNVLPQIFNLREITIEEVLQNVMYRQKAKSVL